MYKIQLVWLSLLSYTTACENHTVSLYMMSHEGFVQSNTIIHLMFTVFTQQQCYLEDGC